MLQDKFVPPSGAFTRSVTVRFSHCDPAGIVYFPHYFDIFNGLIEDWYGQELGYDYAELIMGSKYGFPFVHLDCDQYKSYKDAIEYLAPRMVPCGVIWCDDVDCLPGAGEAMYGFAQQHGIQVFKDQKPYLQF